MPRDNDGVEHTPSLRIEARRYDDPVAGALIEALQQVYEVRYGSRDLEPVTPADFAPPTGVLLVGFLGEEPVGCGGWRAVGPGLAEIKRMFVVHGARGRGLSRVLLSAVEDSARRNGMTRVRLQTGDLQPEAHGLYMSSGYDRI